MNNTVTFESNTIRIGLSRATAQPTVVPVVTIAPPALVTAAPADALLGQGRSAMQTAALVLGALFAASLALFIVSTCIRAYRKGKSQAAYDHLELAERRDYTEAPEEDFDEENVEEPDQADDDFLAPVARVELPHEQVLNRAEEDARKAAAELKDIQNTDEEGGYRVSRPIELEAIKPAVEQPTLELLEENQEPDPAPTEGRRRRRAARREEEE